MNESEITLLKNYPCLHFKKNDYIIRQGNKIKYVYFLTKGICKRNAFTNKGDEIIYDLLSANHSVGCFLGALTVYHPEPLHPTNFIAQSDCICYRLSVEQFQSFLSAHPDVLHELLYLVMSRYFVLDKNFQSKQKQSTANRVCSLLVENLYEKDHDYYVKTYLTNSEISRYLGIHRVTVVKIMKQLTVEEIIQKTANGVLIKDIDRLLVYARDEALLKYTHT